MGLLCAGGSAYGQKQYSIRHYTNENGLPAQSIKGIALDKKNGFLWIGTQAGLVRFDGRRFRDFNLSDGLATASRIGFIARNKAGEIYCEDDRFSIHRIGNDRPEFLMTDSFFRNAFSVSGGRFEPHAARRVAAWLRAHPWFPYLPNLIAFEGKKTDQPGYSFIYFGQVCHYSAKEDSLRFFNDPGFRQIIRLGGKTYFVRFNQELWWYSSKEKNLVRKSVRGMPAWHEKEEEKPVFIPQPEGEAPLLIYKQDIWKLKEDGNELYLEPYCKGCSPLKAYITSAEIWEEQGLLFLSSTVKGIYVVRKPLLQPVIADTSDHTPVEYAQVEVLPGIVNTPTGLAYSTNGKLLAGGTRLRFPYSNIYKDKKGDCWSYKADTLFRYSPYTGELKKIIVPVSAVRRVFVESGDRLYVVSDAEIGEISGDTYMPLFRQPNASNDLGNAFNPDDVLEWKPGILAIAAEQLLFYDLNKRNPPDTLKIPGLTAKVRCLMKYGEYLFIGTYGQGIYSYKNGITKKLPLDKNRYLLYTHCFMPDDAGYLWLSTNRGLFKASLKAMIAAWEQELPEIYFHYLGKNDGLFNTELNGGCQPCALKLSNGLFSFPSMNGMVLLDPLNTHPPLASGKLIIEEILADGSPLSASDRQLQELPSSLRNLRFKLTLPHFGNEENVYFSYQLRGYNDEWETQEILENSTVHFGGLQPGSYTLKFRVRNGFGPDEFNTTTISFRILQPWYNTWWAYILFFSEFVLLTWSLVKWRTARINKRKKELQQQVEQQTENIAAQSRQLESQLLQLKNQQLMLEEDNAIKSRLIGIISHDLISPLKFMGYMGIKLKEDFNPGQSGYQTAEYITTVARELESLSVNILNWIRFHHHSVAMQPERFDLHELISESVEIPSALAKEKGLAFHHELSAGVTICQYRQAIGVIVYNLAMNAVKYTTTGSIQITGLCTGKEIFITVTDTGRGMLPDIVEQLNIPETMTPGNKGEGEKKYQFGYVIIKDLLRLTKGKLQVESKMGAGTRVTVSFQLEEDGIEKN